MGNSDSSESQRPHGVQAADHSNQNTYDRAPPNRTYHGMMQPYQNGNRNTTDSQPIRRAVANHHYERNVMTNDPTQPRVAAARADHMETRGRVNLTSNANVNSNQMPRLIHERAQPFARYHQHQQEMAQKIGRA